MIKKIEKILNKKQYAKIWKTLNKTKNENKYKFIYN